MKGRRTKAPKARRPRAWSNDLEPIAPTCRGEPAWDALATVRLGLHGIVSAALVRRGLDAAILFIDRGQKGTPWPDPIWPVGDTTGCHLIVAPVRSYRRTLFKLDKKAARHFGLSVDALRRKWLDKWGTVWAAVEEQARYNQRLAAKRERQERREAGGRPAATPVRE